MPDGRDVKIFTLTNKNGIVAQITEYGATLVSVETPDQHGQSADITHGFDTLDGWLNNAAYFGATVGRYGNRIAAGKFTLDGKEYKLNQNEAPGNIPCHLHGGNMGFHQVIWSSKTWSKEDASGVTLHYTSTDGEEGYPGTLHCEISYTLNNENELIWEARATTENKPTPVNIIQHTYWNLSGNPLTNIGNHLLTVHADKFLKTNIGLIPTGEKIPVSGTPLDFTTATLIGERINDPHEALHLAGGYDHSWILDSENASPQHAATLSDPSTGRTLQILTNQPCLQCYSGNFLDGTITGKKGKKYPHRSAICLETQAFPDAPNHPNFPNSILRPGETYHHTMIHRFSW